MFYFCTPKTWENHIFLVIAGCKEIEYWLKMG